jgi:hypothetical protein
MRWKSNLTELTEEIMSTVDEVVEESTTQILTHSQLDDGRKNEVRGLIAKDLLRLFGQVEYGLVRFGYRPPRHPNAMVIPTLRGSKS